MCADVPCLSLQRSSRPVHDCVIAIVKRCLIVLFVCTHGVRGAFQIQIIMQFYFAASLLRLCVYVSMCLWLAIVHVAGLYERTYLRTIIHGRSYLRTFVYMCVCMCMCVHIHVRRRELQQSLVALHSIYTRQIGVTCVQIPWTR